MTFVKTVEYTSQYKVVLAGTAITRPRHGYITEAFPPLSWFITEPADNYHEISTTIHPNPLDDTEDTMNDDNTNQKKRKSKWTTSYSTMTIPEAEERLGFRMNTIKAVSVQRMLRDANYILEGEDTILVTKEKVYNHILQYLIMEGYPTESNQYFKETNVNDLVLYTIGPILTDFILNTGRNSIQLLREKEIVSTDSETGGYEEFVMMDLISVKESNYILIIEAKKASLGDAMKQCLLAMKDARDNNGGGVVYGFITTGESWQMLIYDGKFQISEKMDVLFHTMDEAKERWMKDYSLLVDCMYAALNSGGSLVPTPYEQTSSSVGGLGTSLQWRHCSEMKVEFFPGCGD